MSDNQDIIFAGNVAIIQGEDYSNEILEISNGDLSNFGTFELPVVSSHAIVSDKHLDAKLLYGSWVESGDEDRQLEELYKSRLIPSSTPEE